MPYIPAPSGRLLLPSSMATNRIRRPLECDAYWKRQADTHGEFVRVGPIPDGNGTHLITEEVRREFGYVSIGPPDATTNVLIVPLAHDNEPAGLNAEPVLGDCLLGDNARPQLENKGIAVHFFRAAPRGPSQNQWMFLERSPTLDDLSLMGHRPSALDQAVWGMDFLHREFEYRARFPAPKAYMAVTDAVRPECVIEIHGMQLSRGAFGITNVLTLPAGTRLVQTCEPIWDQFRAAATLLGFQLDGVGDVAVRAEKRTRSLGPAVHAAQTSAALYDQERVLHETGAIPGPFQFDQGGGIIDYLRMIGLDKTIVIKIEAPISEIRGAVPDLADGRTREEVDALAREYESAILTQYRMEIEYALPRAAQQDQSAARMVEWAMRRAEHGTLRPPITNPYDAADADFSYTVLRKSGFSMDVIAGMAARLVEKHDQPAARGMRGLIRQRNARIVKETDVAQWPIGSQADLAALTTLVALEQRFDLRLLPSEAHRRIEETMSQLGTNRAAKTSLAS